MSVRLGNEPIVWLLQESWSNKTDLTSAREYGKIIPILTTSDLPSVASGPCTFKLQKALREYMPGDYLLYAMSDPAVIALATAVLIKLGLAREPVQWLRWERSRDIDGNRREGRGFYVPSKIQLGGDF